MSLIITLVGLVLASAYVGVILGLIYAAAQVEREDLDARDQWHTERGEY